MPAKHRFGGSTRRRAFRVGDLVRKHVGSHRGETGVIREILWDAFEGKCADVYFMAGYSQLNACRDLRRLRRGRGDGGSHA